MNDKFIYDKIIFWQKYSHDVKLVYSLVHCEWTDWKIGECDKPCGGGVRTNTRTIKIEARFGGEECKGSSNETENCNVMGCLGNMLFHLSVIEKLSAIVHKISKYY